MNDPLHLLDERSGADALEREVLRADRWSQPTASDSAVVWSKLASELGLPSTLVSLAAVSTGATSTLSAAKTLTPAASGSLALAKGIAIGVLGCAAFWGGAKLLGSPEPSPAEELRPSTVLTTSSAARAPAVPPEPTVPQRAAVVGNATSSVGTRASPAPRAASDSPPPQADAPTTSAFDDEPGEPLQSRTSQLQQEALLLRRARERLRADELSAAKQLLEESGAKFATPQLHQEREALAIELLFRGGERAAATARARAFLTAFPDSPHASRVQTFATP